MNRTRRLHRWPSTAVLIGVALVLWGYIVGPLVGTFRRSLTGPTPFTDYLQFFDFSSAPGEALLGSIGISILSVIGAGVTGVFLAVILERWDFPLRGACRIFALVPIALPPLMGVAAFAKLYGLGGTFPQLLQNFFHNPDPRAFTIDGIAGVLLVHTLTMYPYFYLSVTAAIEQRDDSIEEAALSLGASRFQTWTRVILPMLTPAIVAGALLTFMSSMASYTAPLLFNVDRVMTRQIVEADTNGDLALSSAASAMLAIVSVIFLIFLTRWERKSDYRTQSKGGSRRRHRVTRPAARAAITIVALLSTAFLVLPIAMIFVLALSVDGSWRTAPLPSEYTLQNLTKLFTDAGTWAPIRNSIEMSALAAVGAIFLGVASAYVLARRKIRGRILLDMAIMLPWALPGTVVAFNLIRAFSTPSLFSLGQPLVGTFAILPLAYFVRFSPLVFRSTTASLSQLDPAFEEAARSLGGTWWYAFRRVTLPLLYPGIAAGALLAFVNGIGEFVATILLHSQPKYRPLSIAIFEEFYRGNFGTAAAWGVVQVVLVFLVLVVTRRVQRQSNWMKT